MDHERIHKINFIHKGVSNAQKHIFNVTHHKPYVWGLTDATELCKCIVYIYLYIII